MATRVVKKLSPAELERNQAVLLNTGLAIGQHKGVYQMSSKDGRFVFRNYYPTTFNLFGMKKEDDFFYLSHFDVSLRASSG